MKPVIDKMCNVKFDRDSTFQLALPHELVDLGDSLAPLSALFVSTPASGAGDLLTTILPFSVTTALEKLLTVNNERKMPILSKSRDTEPNACSCELVRN